MLEEHQGQSVEPATSSNLLRKVLLGVAVIYVLASLYFIFDTRSRLENLEAKQKAAATENAQLLKRLGIAESSLKVQTEVLEEKVGMTQKEIASRTASLQRQQKEAEQRLSEQTKKQVGAVSGEVAGVKTELGGARSDRPWASGLLSGPGEGSFPSTGQPRSVLGRRKIP